jgi:hypothetical protein
LFFSSFLFCCVFLYNIMSFDVIVGGPLQMHCQVHVYDPTVDPFIH